MVVDIDIIAGRTRSLSFSLSRLLFLFPFTKERERGGERGLSRNRTLHCRGPTLYLMQRLFGALFDSAVHEEQSMRRGVSRFHSRRIERRSRVVHFDFILSTPGGWPVLDSKNGIVWERKGAIASGRRDDLIKKTARRSRMHEFNPSVETNGYSKENFSCQKCVETLLRLNKKFIS